MVDAHKLTLLVVFAATALAIAIAMACAYRDRRRRRQREAFEQSSAGNRLSHKVSQNVSPIAASVLNAGDWLCRPGNNAMVQSGLLRSLAVDDHQKTVCMLGSLSAPALQQRGGCSTANSALYDAAFSDLVEDISLQEGVDGVAKCAVTLNMPPPAVAATAGHSSVGKARSYDSFLKKRSIEISPTYITLKAQYEEVKALYEQRKREYEAMKADYERLTRERNACSTNEAAQLAEETRLRREVDACNVERNACEGIRHDRDGWYMRYVGPLLPVFVRSSNFSGGGGGGGGSIAAITAKSSSKKKPKKPTRGRLPWETFEQAPPESKVVMGTEEMMEGELEELLKAGRVRSTRDAMKSHSGWSPPTPTAPQAAAPDEEDVGPPRWWTLQQPDTSSSSAPAGPARRPAQMSSGAPGGLTDRIAQGMTSQGMSMMSLGDVGCVVGTHAMNQAGLVRTNVKHADTRVTACMFPAMAKELLEQQGGCSKSNAAVYHSRFASLIDNIAEEDGYEGIERCVVRFHKGNPLAAASVGGLSPQEVGDLAKQYDAFVRENTVTMSDEYKELMAKYIEMKRKHDEMVIMLADMTAMRNDMQNQLSACWQRVHECTLRQADLRGQRANCISKRDWCKNTQPGWAQLYERCGFGGQSFAVSNTKVPEYRIPFTVRSVKLHNGAHIELRSSGRTRIISNSDSCIDNTLSFSLFSFKWNGSSYAKLLAPAG